MITMSARTADAALRAHRPRALRHCHLATDIAKSVGTSYVTNEMDVPPIFE